MEFISRNRAKSATLLITIVTTLLCFSTETAALGEHRNAYATMMYMGTPRDYEFYVAIRVMIRSLVKLDVDADIVVIASNDVPQKWVNSFFLKDKSRLNYADASSLALDIRSVLGPENVVCSTFQAEFQKTSGVNSNRSWRDLFPEPSPDYAPQPDEHTPPNTNI